MPFWRYQNLDRVALPLERDKSSNNNDNKKQPYVVALKGTRHPQGAATTISQRINDNHDVIKALVATYMLTLSLV